MRALELKIPPPLVTLIFGLSMWGLSYVLPSIEVFWTGRLILANVLGALGVTCAILGYQAFQRAKTTVNPMNPQAASSVVTSGIYSVTRNPMYTGLTLLLLGWVVWLAVPWLFLAPLAFALYITRFQIIPEERILSAKFGREYDDYRRRVRRWL